MEERKPLRQDLQARGFRLACGIVLLHRQMLRERRVPYRLANQVLSSGTSIGANLEETKSAQSLKDLRSKYAIALKEARETRYWLRLLTETNLVTETNVGALLEEIRELIAILTSCVRRIHTDPKRAKPSVLESLNP